LSFTSDYAPRNPEFREMLSNAGIISNEMESVCAAAVLPGANPRLTIMRERAMLEAQWPWPGNWAVGILDQISGIGEHESLRM
jgi:hypothetical protein